MKIKVCMNRLVFLRNLMLTPGLFEFLPDMDESEIIELSKNGLIVIPNCVPVQQITLAKSKKDCTKNVPISFDLGGYVYDGFLQHNKIINAKSEVKKCEKSYVLLSRSRTLIVFDGKSSTQFSTYQVVDVERSKTANWDKFNFPHLSEVLTDVQVIQEIYSPLEIVKGADLKIKIENSISEMILWDKFLILSSYLYEFYVSIRTYLILVSIFNYGSNIQRISG